MPIDSRPLHNSATSHAKVPNAASLSVSATYRLQRFVQRSRHRLYTTDTSKIVPSITVPLEPCKPPQGASTRVPPIFTYALLKWRLISSGAMTTVPKTHRCLVSLVMPKKETVPMMYLEPTGVTWHPAP